MFELPESNIPGSPDYLGMSPEPDFGTLPSKTSRQIDDDGSLDASPLLNSAPQIILQVYPEYETECGEAAISLPIRGHIFGALALKK